MDNREEYAKALLKYNGKLCRVFLVNSHCLVGVVQYDGGQWLHIVRNKSTSCTVNTDSIVSIGEV